MKIKISFIAIILIIILSIIVEENNSIKNTTNKEQDTIYPCYINDSYADSIDNDTILKTDINGNVYYTK